MHTNASQFKVVAIAIIAVILISCILLLIFRPDAIVDRIRLVGLAFQIIGIPIIMKSIYQLIAQFWNLKDKMKKLLHAPIVISRTVEDTLLLVDNIRHSVSSGTVTLDDTPALTMFLTAVLLS